MPNGIIISSLKYLTINFNRKKIQERSYRRKKKVNLFSVSHFLTELLQLAFQSPSKSNPFSSHFLET
jgi:hypothetical protein